MGSSQLIPRIPNACPPSGVNPCLHQVNADGFGNALNRYAWSMKVFGPYLYVGTLNTLDATVAVQESIPLPGAGDPVVFQPDLARLEFDGIGCGGVLPIDEGEPGVGRVRSARAGA